MKIIHYIPSIDRTSGGTTVYMQLLAKELGKLTELHIITHQGAHPVEVENSYKKFFITLLASASKPIRRA